ncbi:GGDEF domain-containing protein [Arsukibacterium sp.]|uniref:GGDEF domain-containing protein n=1 Tax=Arsukibacterium sp. TaxID=1977258 RepID=UPI002FDAA5BA
MSSLLYAIAGFMLGLLPSLLATRYWHRKLVQRSKELETNLQQQALELQITLTELTEKNAQLLKQSQIDSLSGLFNRAHFDQRLQAEIRRSQREQRPLALLLLDVDHFKRINDNLGHQAGDAAISQLASLLQHCLKRSSDQAFRYGGEEFALLLPNTNLQGALDLAEHIRSYVASQPLILANQARPLTLSIGACSAIALAEYSPADYIAAADQALYQAKASGRNQVQQQSLVCSIEPSTVDIQHEH